MAVIAIHSDRPDEIENNFYAALRGELGRPFDDSALYTFLSEGVLEDRDWRQPDRWFCSELVAWALERAGFWPYELVVPKNRVSPADLLLLLNPFMNTKTFWKQVPGLVLGTHER